MNRGDIWMVNLGGRIGKRPVLIITRQNVLKYLNKVTVLEITTQGKGYPTEIFIDQKANGCGSFKTTCYSIISVS